jgi:hypothetical protein
MSAASPGRERGFLERSSSASSLAGAAAARSQARRSSRRSPAVASASARCAARRATLEPAWYTAVLGSGCRNSSRPPAPDTSSVFSAGSSECRSSPSATRRPGRRRSCRGRPCRSRPRRGAPAGTRQGATRPAEGRYARGWLRPGAPRERFGAGELLAAQQGRQLDKRKRISGGCGEQLLVHLGSDRDFVVADEQCLRRLVVERGERQLGELGPVEQRRLAVLHREELRDGVCPIRLASRTEKARACRSPARRHT